MSKTIVLFSLIAFSASTIAVPDGLHFPVLDPNLKILHPETTEIKTTPEGIIPVQSAFKPINVIYGIKDGAPFTYIPVGNTHGSSALPLDVVPTHTHVFTDEIKLPNLHIPTSLLDDPTATVPVQLGPLLDLLGVIVNAIKRAADRRAEAQKPQA